MDLREKYSKELLELEKAGYVYLDDGWFCVNTKPLKKRHFRFTDLNHIGIMKEIIVKKMDLIMRMELNTYRNETDRYLFAHSCEIEKFLKLYMNSYRQDHNIDNIFFAVNREPLYEEEGRSIKVKHIEICPCCRKELPKSIIGYMKLKHG